MKRFFIHIICLFIIIPSWRKKFRRWINTVPVSSYQHTHKRYERVLKLIRKRVKTSGKVRVAFFVLETTVFPGRPLFEKMLKDPFFDPFIVIIPNTYLNDKARMHRHMDITFPVFSQAYPNAVRRCYDQNQKFLDFSDQADLICPSKPYDQMTHRFYTSSYLKDKPVLCFFINYAYQGRTKYERFIYEAPFYSYVWKVFVESPKTLDEIKKRQPINGKNLIATGYVKMDDMANQVVTQRTRKKIIIAPHHTVAFAKGGLNLSQFLRYADLFLQLPEKYPQIDFVFRPHPVTFQRIEEENVWTHQDVELYIQRLTSYSNVVYDTSDTYFDTFLNSDGLIHDCGSFLAEYFFTPHPQCYLLRDEAAIDEEFIEFGKEMLDHVYKAFSEDQIIRFIEDVVIKEQDAMKSDRQKFAEESIMYGYPSASQTVINYLKKELK